jgi:NAD dependent epimerase/dehydratase family enzyme
LSKEGGALKEFLKPLRYGVTTILGNGKQVISWIHIDDLVRMYITAIEDERFSGAYNAVAPHPVSNKEFTLQLARIKKGKFFIPLHVPSFILRLVLGEMSVEVLKSATVSSSKIQVQGFKFLYPHLHEAIHQLFPGS